MEKYKILSVVILIITILSLLCPVISSLADTTTVEYHGSISYGGSTVGRFTVNGEVAFCMDHKKKTPPTGTSASSEIYENDNVLKVLYYGWKGTEPYGFVSEAQGVVFTSLALDHFVNGNTNRVAQNFINYVNSKPVPEVTLSFSQNNLNAYRDGDIQRTQTVTVNGNSNFYLTLQLRDDITIINETTGYRQKGGSVNLYGGQNFHLEAPLTTTGRWTSADINNNKYKYQTIVYRTNNNNYQDLAGRYQAVPVPTSIINLNVDWLELASLKIHKSDDETGEAIANTKFELRDAETNSLVRTVETDENGFAEILNIEPKKYVLYEIKSNDNYIKNDEPITIEINAGETKEIEVTNHHKEGKLRVIKVDSRDMTTPIKGVRFEVYSIDENKLIQTIETDENGEANLQLRTGKYRIKEISTGENYILNTEEKEFVIEYNTITELKLGNDIKKACIEINKVDADYKDIKLANVKFEIKDETGKIVDTLITNEQGYAKSKPLAIDKKYVVVETEVSFPYILNSEELNVTFENANNVVLNITNKHKEGSLKIYKTDKDNNRIGIGNVEFDLYSDEFQKVIGTYYTDVNGEIHIQGLRTGKFFLIEKNTNQWYELNDEKIEIEIKEGENEITVENELKKGRIKVIKVDEEDNTIKIPDVEFDVLDENDNILETIKTDMNGEAFTSYYPIRDYEKLYIREKNTNEKYVLDDTLHEVVLEEGDIDFIFENKKIKGQIKVIKIAEEDNKITGDKAGTPIPNVSFGVYDENKNFIEKITTDENGVAITSEMDKGLYFIKEMQGETGEWYQLNENEYSAEIKKDGEIVELEIANKPDNPEIDVEKEGIIQTTANEEIKYEFSIKNTGNVPLDNFTWYDFLPTDYITVTKLITGTYNQDLNYAIYYKTNKNDYRLLRDNLNTKVNNYIDFSVLELEDDEFVTEFKAEFGTVNVGFTSVESPQLFVKVKSTVKNEDTFTNETKVDGYHKTYYVYDEDNHTTEIYEKEIEVKLPRTGY